MFMDNSLAETFAHLKTSHFTGDLFMKPHFKLFLLILLLCCSVPVQVKAENSWWDKGVDIFKSITGDTESTGTTGPSSTEIRDAFKQALRMGTENVVNQLGTTGGFSADPIIHIPLPRQLQTVKTVLSKVGMTYLAEDLELKLNRAAEAATPKAKKLFFQAIQEMTFNDLMAIYNGPKDSATQYFRGKMSSSLKNEMRPIIDNTLSEVGALNAYDQFIGRYKSIPLVPDVKADLTEHVLEKGLDGIFYYMAEEESSIRENPARHTTKLLKKVFGIQQ